MAMDQAGGKIGFDRSRVRILLCDRDPDTAQEVKELLCHCSYQVSVVKTARQVVEVLNIVDSKVDLVLAEVELPNGRGFKMLRHIVKTDSFKHIPIVMMSARDEMAVVVKCLRLGAADYLVKPLRVNELLNLWTHMWRRRRMLGLTEKHIIKGHIASKNIIAEIFVSDTSESNTISLSEDSTEAKFKAKESTHLMPISEEQVVASPEPPEPPTSATKGKEEAQYNERRLSPPRKCGLKLGHSSAFLSYTKSVSRIPPANAEKPDATTTTNVDNEVQQRAQAGAESCNGENNAAASEDNQFQLPEALWQMSDPRARSVFHSNSQPHLIPPLMLTHSLHPSTLMPPAAIHYYQTVQQDNVAAALHSTPTTFSYYPFPIHVPAQQVGPWTSPGTTASAGAMVSPSEIKSGASERREAALSKFRQKRKDRCFEKKIRYASRKRLAEQRPRVKGQFVKRTGEYGEEDEDDEETAGELSPDSVTP